MTSNVDLSPTQSLNVKVLLRCDIPIESRGRITAVETGASETRYRIKSLPSHYKNSINLHLQKLMISPRSH